MQAVDRHGLDSASLLKLKQAWRDRFRSPVLGLTLPYTVPGLLFIQEHTCSM